MTEKERIKKENAADIHQAQVETFLPLISKSSLLNLGIDDFYDDSSSFSITILNMLETLVLDLLPNETIEEIGLDDPDRRRLSFEMVHSKNKPKGKDIVLTVEEFWENEDDLRWGGDWRSSGFYDEFIPFEGWLAIEKPEGPLTEALQLLGCDGIKEFIDLIHEATNLKYHAEGPEVVSYGVRDVEGEPYLISAVFYDAYGHEKDRFVGFYPNDEAAKHSHASETSQATQHYTSYKDLLQGFLQWCKPHIKAPMLTFGGIEYGIFADAVRFKLDKDFRYVKLMNINVLPEIAKDGVKKYSERNGIQHHGEPGYLMDLTVRNAEAFHYWATNR